MLCTVLFMAMLASAPAVLSSQAQSSHAPQTYSLTEANSMMVDGMTVKIARDGSKESMEQIVAPSAKGPGMHVRALYDFAAHKVYTIDMTGVSPCTVVTYTSPAVPAMYDPISGTEEAAAEFDRLKPTVLRTETINGIAAKVVEIADPDGQGKTRLWLDEKLNFPVRWVSVGADGKEKTQMEVKSVSFAKPPADLFVPPQNCQALAGETNASGGHVEMGVQAPTPAAGQGAGAQAPSRTTPGRADAPAQPSRPAGRGQAAPTGVQVTEVRAVGARPTPDYKGASPATFEFVFSITANGPVEIKYILLNQADRVWNSGTLAFDAAGTKEVTIPVKVGVPGGTVWEGWAKLQVYAPNKIESEPVKISADCRGK
jgi:outer membrane lipoprotein-sorting protein